LCLNQSSGSEALESFDDFEVWDVEFFMLWGIVIFFGNENAL
jgi:hypothetical protein